MSLMSGAVNFVRYTVEGTLPENFWEFAAERIARHSFRDIDDTFDERSIGWVSVWDMFDSQFAYASYAVSDYIVLAMRIDERKVSPALLKKFCAKEEERIKKERQLPKLNRRQRNEIKENIQLMLLKKSLPTAAVYELCWNLADSTLLFGSTNKKAQEVLEEFFRESFDMHLVLQVPYMTAENLLPPERRKALSDIRPAIFI